MLKNFLSRISVDRFTNSGQRVLLPAITVGSEDGCWGAPPCYWVLLAFWSWSVQIVLNDRPLAKTPLEPEEDDIPL